MPFTISQFLVDRLVPGYIILAANQRHQSWPTLLALLTYDTTMGWVIKCRKIETAEERVSSVGVLDVKECAADEGSELSESKDCEKGTNVQHAQGNAEEAQGAGYKYVTNEESIEKNIAWPSFYWNSVDY